MKKPNILVLGLLLVPFMAQARVQEVSPLSIPMPVRPAPHAVGTNVSAPDGKIYLITGPTQKRPYSSTSAFLSYGFNSLGSVVQANAGDLALGPGQFIVPNDGSLFTSNSSYDKGTTYLISNGTKFAFANNSVFENLGFSFANARTVASNELLFVPQGPQIANATGKHLKGVLININGTVVYMGTHGYYGIPDMATFNSWGMTFSSVVTANAADKALSQVGVISMRQPGQLVPAVQ